MTRTKGLSLSVIRRHCIDCSGDSFKAVVWCPVTDCALWPFRLGMNPATVRSKYGPGLVTAGMMPAATGMVADLSPESRRAQWIGILSGGASIGWIAGPVLGGLLYDRWIEVDFLARLREIRKFSSVGELLAQMARDVAATREVTAV